VALGQARLPKLRVAARHSPLARRSDLRLYDCGKGGGRHRSQTELNCRDLLVIDEEVDTAGIPRSCVSPARTSSLAGAASPSRCVGRQSTSSSPAAGRPPGPAQQSARDRPILGRRCAAPRRTAGGGPEVVGDACSVSLRPSDVSPLSASRKVRTVTDVSRTPLSFIRSQYASPVSVGSSRTTRRLE
jgi:hypothetical protein